MLKMKIDPTMFMKTHAKMTQCLAINPTFYTKMHQLHDNRQDLVGHFG